jgi:hypothetical protein
MASEVKTNKVSPATGTTLNVGDSGDTLALATDAVTGFQVGSDAAGDVLYHDGTDYTRLAKPGTPAGELLTFATSATAPSWVAAAAGGLTDASQWRLTADFTNSATITTNLEQNDNAGYSNLGSAMTESSGIFTFPSTGYWFITFYCSFDGHTNSANPMGGSIETSINTGGAWTEQTGQTGPTVDGYVNNTNATFLFDVTNTTTHLCRFVFTAGGSPDNCKGSSTVSETYMTFVKLADT